jgi:hypothetical protein
LERPDTEAIRQLCWWSLRRDDEVMTMIDSCRFLDFASRQAVKVALQEQRRAS